MQVLDAEERLETAFEGWPLSRVGVPALGHQLVKVIRTGVWLLQAASLIDLK